VTSSLEESIHNKTNLSSKMMLSLQPSITHLSIKVVKEGGHQRGGRSWRGSALDMLDGQEKRKRMI
jgi:hypothetical protein